jgi:hypothetical protein
MCQFFVFYPTVLVATVLPRVAHGLVDNMNNLGISIKFLHAYCTYPRYGRARTTILRWGITFWSHLHAL